MHLPREGLGSWPEALPVDASVDDSFPDSPGPSLRMTVCSPNYQLQPASFKILCCEDFLRFRFKFFCVLPSVVVVVVTGTHFVLGIILITFTWICLFNPPSL